MTQRILGFGLLVLGALVSLNCSSSGSDGGGGGSGSFDCNTGCDKIVAVGCPNDNKAKCMQECQDDLAQAGACSSQTGNLYNCLLGQPLSCDADGEASVDSSAISGACMTQAIDSARCSACVADSNDDACDSCQKQSCCTETKAIYDDPSFTAYYKCYTGCQDSTCQSNCIKQYPSIEQKGGAVSSCISSKCASACSGP